MFYIKLAWRNIWRNKKRSLITIGSIFFAVLFAIILRSMQLGMYDKMIDSVVRSWFGYIQIHEKGYWEEQSLENTFERNITLEEELTKQNEIENVIPRVEGFALLSYSEKVRGIHLAGIEPEKENRLSKIKEKIISGEY
ncbi:MAG: ABC transporter permease, partial [Chitinophagales bacterium]|nr:ABC transporter permease [Chitinophagales bacterium]